MLEPQNWTTEFKEAFKDLTSLHAFLGWEMNDQLLAVEKKYPVFIPLKLAQKIKAEGPSGILAREFIPHPDEADLVLNESGMNDPIGDKAHLVAPQLIHRYPSRALFTATHICPVLCRYCFRKNELESQDEVFQKEFDKTLAYLIQHPEISEIIFTGGDPFTLSNDKLSSYLKAFAEIPSIKDIRFHTRYAVILPSRIDAGLSQVLIEASKMFRTVTVGLHINHVNELDLESFEAIKKLSELPLQLLSQTVLLKGVNDSHQTLIELFELFISCKIRPYYLHHPDRVKGGMHFYLPLKTGREIYAGLRGQLPGWALPHYVLDLPGGFGKISAFNPETTNFSGQFLTLSGDLLPLSELS